MRLTLILTGVVAALFCHVLVEADVYTWTGEDGVIHFTNHSPPAEAKIFVKDLPSPDPSPEYEPPTSAQTSTRQEELLQDVSDQLEEKNILLEETIERLDAAERRLQMVSRQVDRALYESQRLAHEEAYDGTYGDSGGSYIGYRRYYPVGYIYRHNRKGAYRHGYHHRKKHFKKKNLHKKRLHQKRFSDLGSFIKAHTGFPSRRHLVKKHHAKQRHFKNYRKSYSSRRYQARSRPRGGFRPGRF
jgi:hypothetical protein